MFIVDPTSRSITLSRGDTGSVTITTNTEYTFAEADRAVFTVKSASGEIVKESNNAIDENNQFQINFVNSDTDSLAPGTYSWDVRYVINPYYDSNGRIINGDQVITPYTPMTLTLLGVVGEV